MPGLSDKKPATSEELDRFDRKSTGYSAMIATLNTVFQ
jgi:hypothetical protein